MKEIFNLLETILKSYNPGDELELRKGVYEYNHFSAKINKYKYIQLKDYIYKHYTSFDLQEMTIYFYKNKVKHIIHKNENKEYTIKKVNKHNVDLKSFNVRCSLASEQKVDRPTNILHNYKIHRYRISCKVNSLFKIEISEDISEHRVVYRYEIEFIKKPDVKELYETIQFMNKIL